MTSPPKNKGARKVLVYLIGSLGDTVVAIPALRAVRVHFRDAEIVLLENSQPDGVVTAWEVLPDGLIDRRLTYTSSQNYFGLWRQIRSEKFSAAVYLVISERPARSVRRDRLFFRSCGIKQLIGFHAFSDAELYPVANNGSPRMSEHEAIRKLDRIERDGVISDRDEILKLPFFRFADLETAEMSRWLDSRRRSPESKLVAFASGCKTRSNEWPTERFVEVGHHLIERGFEVVLVGGSPDISVASEITAALGQGINATGRFSVRESAILLSLCDLYIGLDTGSTHLAYAAGKPCFSIFGERNNPGQWFPLGDTNMVVSHPVQCSGCRLFECPVEGHPCMQGITADAVKFHLDRFVAANFGREMTSEEKIVSV